jgi:hypothetical protein
VQDRFITENTSTYGRNKMGGGEWRWIWGMKAPGRNQDKIEDDKIKDDKIKDDKNEDNKIRDNKNTVERSCISVSFNPLNL